MREQRAERRVVRALDGRRHGEPLVELDLTDQRQCRLGHGALRERVCPVFVGQARHLDHVVVAQAPDRASVRHVQDQRHLPALHGRGHHRGRDAFVALAREHVVVGVDGLAFMALATLAREVRRVALTHRAFPRRARAGKIARVHQARSAGHRASFNIWSCLPRELPEPRMCATAWSR